jgi:hypothetical protein
MFSAPTIGLAAVLFAWVSQAQPFNCQITVPPNPLTAQGLATPYKMTGCNQVREIITRVTIVVRFELSSQCEDTLLLDLIR